MDRGDIIFVLLGLFIAFQLVRVGREIYKDRRDISRDYRKFGKDFAGLMRDLRALWGAYGRGRRSGLGIEDAIQAAGDEMAGKKPSVVPPEPRPVEKQSGGFLGLVSTILANAVSILGVYRFDWPVGTALALYWAENVLAALVLIGMTAFWRTSHGEERTPTSLSDITTIAAVFNAAHAVFLLLFLGVMLPRIAPAERFEKSSFVQGLVLIAILLVFQFTLAVRRMPRTSAPQLQRSVSFYLQRIGVLHLTIIIGMFALALFGRARAFFAVFAGLKMLVDVSRRV